MSEADCCRHMVDMCGTTEMPEHICCNTVPQPDVAMIAKRADPRQSIQLNAATLPAVPPMHEAPVLSRAGHVSVSSQSPPDAHSLPSSILRI